MTIREITFPDGEASPGLVMKALELLGLEGRSTLKGPLKQNGKVVGCLVRFNTETDADKFVAAWTGFLELKKTGKLPGPMMPSLTPMLPKIEFPKPE